MSHYTDLTPCDYFGPVDGKLLAIGWLDVEHPFSKGAVTRELFTLLARLGTNAWQPFLTAGRHPCGFCSFSGGPTSIDLDDISVSMGITNIFIPADECTYVAPSLILHYIDAHEYAPPEVFQQAIRACPPMRTTSYLKAIHRHGITRLSNPAT